MNESAIEKLIDLGFKRWTKGNLDRLYVNAAQLGLVCDYYKTGNIRSAEFCGEPISNCHARKLKGAKTFIDIKTGRVYSDISLLTEAAKKLMAEAVDKKGD